MSKISRDCCTNMMCCERRKSQMRCFFAAIVVSLGVHHHLLAFTPLSDQHPRARRRIPFYPHRAGSASVDADDQPGIGIGIDLGTTFSAVAYLKDDVPTIVPIDQHRSTIPSVVLLNPDSSVTVGWTVGSHPLAYRNVKRIIGTGGKLSKGVVSVVPHVRVNPQGKTYKKDSLSNQIDDAQQFPTLLWNASTSEPSVAMDPAIISSYIVRTLKQAVELETGRLVTRAVIGVPAYFHDAQREATIRAAKLAGIDTVKLLREPEAAALAYQSTSDDELVLVFDLGGGTYDVSVLTVGGGISEVVATSGDVTLGGCNWDSRLAEYLLRTLGAAAVTTSSGSSTQDWSAEAKNAVLLAAERIRICLSNSREVTVALPLDAAVWESMSNPNSVLMVDGPKVESNHRNATHLMLQLSRKTVESLCRNEFEALLRPIREVAIMAGALLPGDASPTLVDAALELEEASQKEYANFYKDDDDGKDNDNDDVDDARVRQDLEDSMRQAKKAQQKGRKKARSLDKQERKFRSEARKVADAAAPVSIKVRSGISGRPLSRVILVGGATRMPAIGRLLSALTGVVPQRTVNPDEAVALGCAVHAGVLDGLDAFGKVLNPMQAAILRALAEKQEQRDFNEDEFEEDFDDQNLFDEANYSD